MDGFREETVAAIRRGLEECERGEGVPLEEAEVLLREKYGLGREGE